MFNSCTFLRGEASMFRRKGCRFVIVLIACMASLLVAGTYENDTLIVHCTLFENDIFGVSVESVTDSANGRITAISLAGRNARVLPSIIGDLTELRKLDMSNNAITAIPFELGNCSKLEELLLHHNKIPQIPVEISKLSQLRKLDLSYNSFFRFPKEIGQLSNLEWLDFSNNRINEFHSEITNCTKLEYISFAHNFINYFPSGFSKQKKLRVFDFSHNALTYYSDEINVLTELEQLRINNNNFSTLSAEIMNLVKLTELDISYCNLTEIPSGINKLAALKRLNVRRNNISKIPSGIGSLTKLKEIYVAQNNLHDLPTEITQLSPDTADFGYCFLLSLPGSVVSWLNTHDPDWESTQGSMPIMSRTKRDYFDLNLSISKQNVLRYSLGEGKIATLSLFSMAGKHLGNLVENQNGVGTYLIHLNQLSFAKGNYIIRVTTNTAQSRFVKITIK